MKLLLAFPLALLAVSSLTSVASPRTEPKTPPTTELVKQSSPAVVRIQGLDAAGAEVTGSGFIIDPSGIIVTNLHVVSDLKTAQVRLASGDVYDKVTVRGFDERKDIALIKVAGFGLPTIPLGNSDSVAAGEHVVLIGNPLALDGSVSTGVVSGIRTTDEGYRVIQTDAAANPGNSGGPLLDETGRVIGVLTFKIRGAENLNFVVPINYVRGLMSDSSIVALEDLHSRLSGTVPLLSQTSIPRRWKSLTTGTVRNVRQEGDFIYVELVVSDALAQMGAFAIAELKKDDVGYSGVNRVHWPCPKYDWATHQIVGYAWCGTEALPMRINLLSPTRIEGLGTAYDESDKINCTSCTHSTKAVSRPFVWIPE